MWRVIAVIGAISAACAAPAATVKPSTAPATATAVATATAATPATPGGGQIGPGEGKLNLVIGTGDMRHSSDAASFWVTPFEEQTGCRVDKYEITDPNSGVSLIQSGAYDGISASGDATTRLIQGGDVAPIDMSLLPNYADVFEGLKNLPHNTVDGVNYGTPHSRGPNLLLYNTAKIETAPTSWDPIWEGGSDYKGKISIHDSSIYIADAALHLMVKRPQLGITDPYQLNEEQFDAAMQLLNQLNANDPQYWVATTDQVNSYTAGDVVVGTSWQYQANLLIADHQPIAAVLPGEGSTGWSDTWMMYSQAEHPNCMLMWMDWMMSPLANARATVSSGEAPVSPQACEAAEAIKPGYCDQVHATEEDYFSKVWYWSTPQADCADDDTATTCVTQDDWLQAWKDLRGG
jgi:putative spermidine/putrescine transport system substrate-binding protein